MMSFFRRIMGFLAIMVPIIATLVVSTKPLPLKPTSDSLGNLAMGVLLMWVFFSGFTKVTMAVGAPSQKAVNAIALLLAFATQYLALVWSRGSLNLPLAHYSNWENWMIVSWIIGWPVLDLIEILLPRRPA